MTAFTVANPAGFALLVPAAKISEFPPTMPLKTFSFMPASWPERS